MTWYATEPRTGDIIRIELSMGLYHYGIYVSDDEVIAFGLPPIDGFTVPSEQIKVISTDIEKFFCGRFLEVAKLGFLEKLKARKPNDVVAYARSRIGDGGYNIVKNNCEHFVYECVFGVKKSAQADAAAGALKNLNYAKVYLAEIPADAAFDAPLFPPERMSEIESCRNEKVKLQKYTVWKLLRFAISDAFSVEIEETDIHREESGKWVCSDCFFSLSHTNGVAAVAVSKVPVGVDVERIDREIDRSVFRKAMTKAEEKYYSKHDTGRELIEMWTKKESVFKRRGEDVFKPNNINTFAENIKTFFSEKLGVAVSVSFDGARTDVFEVTDDFTSRVKSDAVAE